MFFATGHCIAHGDIFAIWLTVRDAGFSLYCLHGYEMGFARVCPLEVVSEIRVPLIPEDEGPESAT